MVPFPAALARSAREAGTGGECRRPISGNLLAGNLLNQKGPPQNLFCGALFHVKHFPGLLPLRARRGKRSPAADAGLGCKSWLLLRARTGGSGGHFAFGVMAPRRPFCPLSTGGKWTHAPQRSAAGPIFPSTEGGKTSGGWRQRTKGGGNTKAPQRRLRGKARKKTGELLEEGRKSKEGEKGA